MGVCIVRAWPVTAHCFLFTHTCCRDYEVLKDKKTGSEGEGQTTSGGECDEKRGKT